MANGNCGGTPLVAPAPTFWAVLLAFWGVVSGVAAAISAIAWIATHVDVIVAFLSSSVTIFGYSLWGVAAFFSMILAAAVTAGLIMAWAWESYSALCGAPAAGKLACVSGVINTVQGGFTYAYSEVVGFANNQPRADVVVKSLYWPIVNSGSPPMVWCASCANCPPGTAPPGSGTDSPCSPIMACYYHDPQVCNAAKGSAIGATVGAALGAIGGVIAGVLAFGAVGCSFTVVFSWICMLVLLIIVAVIIVVVALTAFIGSAIGTQAGKAAAGGAAVPTGGASSAVLMPRAYVSVVGNMVPAKQSLGANVIWFAGWIPNANGVTVDDLTASNGNGTTVLGMSQGAPPFCFTDPDANIPAAMDVCPAPSP